LPAYAEFTCLTPDIDVRIPLTLVVAVPLTAQLQKIEGLYLGLRGATLRTGMSPASLSASSI
jgi:hypothetical protein